MSLLRVYIRVIALLAPERALAIMLVVANLMLAGIMLVEPGLFARRTSHRSPAAHHAFGQR
jgi:hypothetical protein